MKRIRVVIKDPSPAIHFGDPPGYRSVLIELTPEQCAALELSCTSKLNEMAICEVVTSVFFD